MRVYGIGRIVRDIELKSSTSGTSYLMNSIACDRRDKDKTTDFISIKAFGKLAENMDRFLKKGSKVLIEGNLQIEEYTDKSGNKKSTPVIMVSNFEFAESKEEKKEDDKKFLEIEDLADLPFA